MKFVNKTNEDRFEEDLSELRRVRASIAVSRIQEHARRTGLDKLSNDQIDQLVKEARRKRKKV